MLSDKVEKNIKDRCCNRDKTLYCIMYKNNTIEFGDNYPHEGGPLVSPGYKSADEYLIAFDTILPLLKNDPSFRSNFSKMLNRHGFYTYDIWKQYIKICEDYIWSKRVRLTQKEIEERLGYKIEIALEE